MKTEQEIREQIKHHEKEMLNMNGLTESQKIINCALNESAIITLYWVLDIERKI